MRDRRPKQGLDDWLQGKSLGEKAFGEDLEGGGHEN